MVHVVVATCGMLENHTMEQYTIHGCSIVSTFGKLASSATRCACNCVLIANISILKIVQEDSSGGILVQTHEFIKIVIGYVGCVCVCVFCVFFCI